MSKRTLSELDEEEAKTEQERLAALAKLDDQKRGWRYQERDVLRICQQVAMRQIPMDYEWFKFLHHKPAVNNLTRMKDQNNYLFPNAAGNSVFLGDKRVSRVWHYFDKELNVRNF